MPDGKKKRALTLATEIAAEIIGNRLPVGTSLGSEEDLLRRFVVSRAVFRESVRILESQGVAEMRMGPGGGLTVTEPTIEPVVQIVDALLARDDGLSVADLFVARVAVEVATVALAASRVDEVGIDRLRALLRERRTASSGEDNFDVDVEFHVALAQAGGSPVCAMLVQLLCGLMRSASGDGTQIPMPTWDEQAGDHAAIIAAVVAGDAALAQHRLRRHLETTVGGSVATGLDQEFAAGVATGV